MKFILSLNMMMLNLSWFKRLLLVQLRMNREKQWKRNWIRCERIKSRTWLICLQIEKLLNKWILKIKRKIDGFIESYKTQLIAKGYTQQNGINYEETISPVVRFASIHLILATIAHMDLELHQMDVKTIFLNEEIYMEQPMDFIIQGQKHKVCKLN